MSADPEGNGKPEDNEKAYLTVKGTISSPTVAALLRNNQKDLAFIIVRSENPDAPIEVPREQLVPLIINQESYAERTDPDTRAKDKEYEVSFTVETQIDGLPLAEIMETDPELATQIIREKSGQLDFKQAAAYLCLPQPAAEPSVATGLDHDELPANAGHAAPPAEPAPARPGDKTVYPAHFEIMLGDDTELTTLHGHELRLLHIMVHSTKGAMSRKEIETAADEADLQFINGASGYKAKVVPRTFLRLVDDLKLIEKKNMSSSEEPMAYALSDRSIAEKILGAARKAASQPAAEPAPHPSP